MSLITKQGSLPLFRPLIWALSTIIIAWWVFLQFLTAHDTGLNYLFNAAYGLPWALAAIGFFWVGWRWRDERYSETTPIVLFGVGYLFSALAQGIWTYYNFAGVDVPEFSLADVFFISGVVIQIVALASLLVHRLRSGPVPRWMAAAFGIGALALSLLVTRMVFGFLHTGGSVFTLDTFYSVTGFLIIFLFILNINRDRHGELRPFLYAMFFAALVSAGGDFVFAIRNSAGTYWNGDFADGLYALSALLVLYAAGRTLPKRIDHDKDVTAKKAQLPSLDVLLPVGIVLLGLIIASRSGQGLYATQTGAIDADARTEARRVADVVSQVLSQEVTRVSAVTGFFNGSQFVSQDEFLTFTRTLNGSRPGSSILLRLDARGVVTHADERDRSRIGIDYSADPDRSAALARAIDARAVTVSEPLILHTGMPGVLVVLPSYDGNGQYQGAAVAGIPLPGLMTKLADILPDERFLTQMHVDGGVLSPDGWVVYDEAGMPKLVGAGYPAPAPIAVASGPGADLEEVDLGGIAWSVTVTPVADQVHGAYVAALSVFLAVLALAFAMAVIVYLLISQRTRLQDLVHRQTRSLRESVAELKQSKFFLDNVSDAVVVMDLHRRMIYRNKAAMSYVGSGYARPASNLWLYDRAGVDVDEVEKALRDDGKWDGEAHLKRSPGRQVDVLISVRPLLDDRGRHIANVALLRDITDRKGIERAKTQFVSMVAHQLRTPMTQLRWLVEQMLEGDGCSKAIREQLEQAQQIVLAENQFVGDLLNVSRIERGVLKLNKKPLALSKLLEETVAPLRPLAKERRTGLTIGKAPQASVNVDEEKIVQALRNVVDNAIKYSPEGNQVSVGAVLEGRTVIISVSDHGTGIPEELQDKLYDIKTEISPGATATSASTGLGLYLTKKFVDAMGGTISFETSPRGTTFRVRLPAV